jgi:hypothetical protein
MLPWDDRPYDPDTKLDDIGSLLPYHIYVVPEVAIGALNRIIGDAGNTVFFDFYTDEQKQADRSKARTGLFFFRGRVRVSACKPWAFGRGCRVLCDSRQAQRGSFAVPRNRPQKETADENRPFAFLTRRYWLFDFNQLL